MRVTRIICCLTPILAGHSTNTRTHWSPIAAEATMQGNIYSYYSIKLIHVYIFPHDLYLQLQWRNNFHVYSRIQKRTCILPEVKTYIILPIHFINGLFPLLYEFPLLRKLWQIRRHIGIRSFHVPAKYFTIWKKIELLCFYNYCSEMSIHPNLKKKWTALYFEIVYKFKIYIREKNLLRIEK